MGRNWGKRVTTYGMPCRSLIRLNCEWHGKKNFTCFVEFGCTKITPPPGPLGPRVPSSPAPRRRD